MNDVRSTDPQSTQLIGGLEDGTHSCAAVQEAKAARMAAADLANIVERQTTPLVRK